MMEEEYRHFYMMKAVNMSSYTKEQRDSQILESISNFRQNMEKMSMKVSWKHGLRNVLTRMIYFSPEYLS